MINQHIHEGDIVRMLENWQIALLAVWPMSQLRMGSTASGRKPNFGLKTRTYFSITIIFGSWDLHFCDLLSLSHMLVVSWSDLSIMLLGVNLSRQEKGSRRVGWQPHTYSWSGTQNLSSNPGDFYPHLTG